MLGNTKSLLVSGDMQVISDQAIAPRILNPETRTDRETLVFDVGGMKCAGCVMAVENRLSQQAGVISASVNLVTEVATVECELGRVNPIALAHQLTDFGFPSQPRLPQPTFDLPDQLLQSQPDPVEQQRRQTRQLLRQVAIAITLLMFSAIGHLDHLGWAIPVLSTIGFHWGLATLTLIFPGRVIFIDGWQGLRYNHPNMNTLIGMGTLTAYAASVVALLLPDLGWECFFDEPVMLIGFILLGRALEQQARGRAAAAFQSLLALQPTLARLIPSQILESPSASAFVPSVSIDIPADRVQVGEWLQVLPGDKIPVDGEVVVGQTTVNESMLTGEALPVVKQPGDFVVAGSFNQSGAIALKATRTGQNTTLAQIIALVESAQTRKAPIQRLADQIAGYFTYGVMAIAILTFLFWDFIGTSRWPELLVSHDGMASGHALLHQMTQTSPLLLSLKLAIAVLVIACPCALGLATPTAILVSSGIGAERGLLIRGGDVLEKVHHLSLVVFDKTGTLTTGQPIVTDVLPCQIDLSMSSLLQLAATVESGTQHPLSRAIQKQAQQQGLSPFAAQDFYTQPGLGVSAQVFGQRVVLGNQDWLNQQAITIDAAAQIQAEAWVATGKTVVYVAIDSEFAGLIAVQDTLRPDAQATIKQLRQLGLRVMMLTGDRPEAAAVVAQTLGLTAKDILANIRPEHKAAAIAELQHQGQCVAMVGDGINDAPALAQADVGISLHSSTEVAIETAEIVLMHDHLSDILESICLSRATFYKIRQNLFWAFAYNILGIPIAAGALLPSFGLALSPATAGALMAFSSVSVVTNSLLLRRKFMIKSRESLP